MRKTLATCLILALLTALVPAALADAISGRGYEDFEACYADNLTFINENTGRHLLPLVLAKGEANEDGGHRNYELYGGNLNVSIRLDQSNKVIEMCRITLTAPAGMAYGTAEYNDFTTLGYHSYALLMAMHTAADPAVRYGLVTAVNDGLAAGAGTYAAQVGAYNLLCTTVEGVATITFEHATAAGTEATEPPDGEIPADVEDDGAYSEDEDYLG